MTNFEVMDIIVKKLEETTRMFGNNNALKELGNMDISLVLTRKRLGVLLGDVIIVMYEGVIIGELMFLEDVITAGDMTTINHKHSMISVFKEHFDERVDIIKANKNAIKAIEKHSRGCYSRKFNKKIVELVPIEYAYKLYPHWK